MGSYRNWDRPEIAYAHTEIGDTEMTHTEFGYAKPVAEKTFLVLSESHCFWGSPMITVLPKLDDPTEIYDVPNVLEYNGVRYGKTGFNSDTGRVFYSVRQYKKLAKLS
jgi:hypothetical protein